MSVIKDVELQNGTTVYIQISDSKDVFGNNTERVTLSFDGQHSDFQIRLTLEELKILAPLIEQALKEYQKG